MIAIIAEKPSVALELAGLVGASDRKDGYFEGGGYTVTWAIGHLVGLALPQDYGLAGYHKDALPILPDPFVLKPRSSTSKDRGKGDKAALRQLSVIKRLFECCDSIIVATDCGREGELIFRYIYDYLECDKPFQRLWVSSLTEKALRAGFKDLLPGSDLDTMYLAARARSRADWLVGINASQALTIVMGGGSYSLGRVQTPTLGMICRRYEEHENFIRENSWQVQLQHTRSFVEFQSVSALRWDDPLKAAEALKSVSKATVAEVIDVEKKTVTEKPPLLYDLTALQKMANKKFGLSASETLAIAQGLYEKQFITYPRTGSRYITMELWDEIPRLIRGLHFAEGFQAMLAKVKIGRLNKQIVDGSKVTDHHGLLITDKVPSCLSAAEAVIYRLIASRLLEAVSEASVCERTEVRLQVIHYEFSASAVMILEPGWRGIQNEFEEIGALAIELPEIKTGDHVKIIGSGLIEKQSQPPALYNDGTLLGAMENAGRLIDDAALKNAIKASGLGTPATRAGTIETLLERGYIERRGKTLIPTAKGLAVHSIVADKAIASVTMTAEWETLLDKIADGAYSSDAFHQAIVKHTRDITLELINSEVPKEHSPELPCPKCKNHNLRINDKAIKCPDQNCGWMLFRNICGRTLTVAEIAALMKTGQTGIIDGMHSKSGKPFKSKLTLDDHLKISFTFVK